MRKLHRIALIALGAVVALGAILVTGVNLYVQSQGTQAKIQRELSQRLGTPLQIRQMSVTPWGGLTLSGITIAQTWAAGPGHFLEAKTFRLRVRFLSLFSRRLVIKEVSLVDPKVVWPQDAKGKWRLPSAQQESAPVAASKEAQPQVTRTAKPQETSATLGPLPPTANKVVKEQPRSFVAPEVRRLSIKNGDFSFLNRNGGVVGQFSGVDFRTSIRSAMALRGDVKVARISLRDRFFLEQLGSRLRYEPDVLELSQISARAAGGEITGYFAMQPEAEDSPFTANVKFRDVLADQIITNAGGPKGIVQGKLDGNFEASGKTADPDALNGKGAISLRDGRVQQYSLLILVGQILQIEELQQLNLEQAEARYHVDAGLVTIEELILRTPNIRLSASGTVTLGGDLKLDSQLAINDKIRGQLFKAIRQNFQPANEPGYYALDFKVGGNIDRPSTDLMKRLVGRDLSNMINSLFGGGNAQRPKRKKKRAEAAAPAPPTDVAPSQPPVPEQTQSPPAATPVASP